MPFAVYRRLLAVFKPPFSITQQQRSIIFHLFMDIAWMGVVSGTVGSFLAVYAARMGASDTQVGLLNAVPAVINMLVGYPAGNWMRAKSLSRVVFWSAFAGRIFYLPLALLPFFLSRPGQVEATLWITLAMSVPLTLLNVSFNSMFADVIPPHQRGYVVGGRNALLSITSLVCTLGCGRLLLLLPQPDGYQVVFAIGFGGAMLSTLHLYLIRDISAGKVHPQSSRDEIARTSTPKIGLPRHLKTWAANLDRRYVKVVALLFTFHIAQWLVIPVSPLLAVHQLGLSDFQISLGVSMFSLISVLFSFQVVRITNRLGNRKTAGFSMIGIGLFPLLLSLSKGFNLYLIAHLVGAFSWAVLAVALLNYLLENTPEQNRSVYMAYYIVASNASILIGSLAGPAIAGIIGYSPALAVFACLRALAGIAVLIWG